MLVSLLKPDFIHSDDRGKLTQLCREGFKQVNVITSKEGAFRGGHYHKQNDEAFFVISGKIQLTLEKESDKETHVFETGDFFLIEPFVIHSFLFMEETTLVSMYSKGVEISETEKDIYSV